MKLQTEHATPSAPPGGFRRALRTLSPQPVNGASAANDAAPPNRAIGNALRLLLALAALLLSIELAAQQPVPELTQRATDLTGTLSAAELESLNARLAALEEQTGSQVAVLMVATTEPETIEAYALRVAEAWQLGREDVDDGVLLLIAKDDRQLRFEIGYGLEGAIPDATANRIIDERIVPRFYVEDYAGGINAGLDAITALIEGEPLPAPPDAPEATGDAWGLVPFLAIAAAFLAPIFRRIFGSVFGPAALGTVAGVIAWFIVGAMFLSLVVGVIVFVVSLGGTGGPGIWATGRRGWGGGFGGGRGGFGGGFRGGGGGFGGGGASGRW